mmetsp:Transcript_27313/g.71463  ORF Transcript_27313/g.71463 Transcript_27313/m.71463 type:complete len:234 (+) Transcript_27313:1016-1717(+)
MRTAQRPSWHNLLPSRSSRRGSPRCRPTRPRWGSWTPPSPCSWWTRRWSSLPTNPRSRRNPLWSSAPTSSSSRCCGLASRPAPRCPRTRPRRPPRAPAARRRRRTPPAHPTPTAPAAAAAASSQPPARGSALCGPAALRRSQAQQRAPRPSQQHSAPAAGAAAAASSAAPEAGCSRCGPAARPRALGGAPGTPSSRHWRLRHRSFPHVQLGHLLHHRGHSSRGDGALEKACCQ